MRLLLLLVLPLLPDGEVPLIAFREPDPATRRWVSDDLLSNNGLGAGTRDKRTAARATLREIGSWTVPFLKDAVWGPRRVKGIRIPMNAVMVLARILDPRALPELRAAASRHEDSEVRKTACLAVGLFRRELDLGLLSSLLQDADFRNGHQRAAALALAKIPGDAAAAVLRAAAATPARDVHVAGATLLAAVIAQPGIDLAPYLNHEEKLLRAVAAVALLLRPVHSDDAGAILSLLRRPREDREVRALQFAALGAVRERTPEIREKLLHCVVKGTEKQEARIAALIGLAAEEGQVELYAPLKSYYRSLQGRNDPQVCALLFAMLRTADPGAVDDLISAMVRGSDFLALYAGGSLLHGLVHAKQQSARDFEIFDALARLRDRSDPLLRELADLSLLLRAETERTARLPLAAEGFAKLRDPRDLHLWDWDLPARAWGTANSLVPALFELDDVAEKSKATSPGGSLPGTKEGRSSATPEEQDFLDFFEERPYFGPEDLRAG